MNDIQRPSNSLLLQRLRTWSLGEIGRQAAETIETLQRNLDLRNEQIDGYERQLGIIDQDAARTIGTEIESLQAVAKLASELCDAVDEDAEDIGGHRPVHVILGELGPAVDKVMPR